MKPIRQKPYRAATHGKHHLGPGSFSAGSFLTNWQHYIGHNDSGDPMPKSVLEIWICNPPLDGQGKGMWQLWELLWKVCSFNCGISWVVMGGLYFVDSIRGLAVRQIRYHRTGATGARDHKEDIKTTSTLLSADTPIIECLLISNWHASFSFVNKLSALRGFNLKIVYQEFAALFMGLNLVLLDLFVRRFCLSFQYSKSDLMLIYCELSVRL